MEPGGRYRIVGRIARGGMAEVLEAVAAGESGFERRVAIKRMLPGFGDEAAMVRMFLDEARIASRLHHAGIVAVLDYGVADELPFQVMEFVDGIDAQRLARAARESGTALPVEIGLHVVAEVAHALDHAHAARDALGRPLGIVHRDVKPSNVLVAWSGDVKLADFGVAFARDRAERTSAGTTKGTPVYMAPEQLLRGEVDGRADVFSLGCVLHALVAGRSPLEGDDAIRDLLAGRDLRLDAALPDDVRAIVARATRAARAGRWETAGAMAAACGAALAARVRTDARTLLRAFLAKLPGRERPARGMLDDLLAVDLVLAPGRGEERRFEARPTVTTVVPRGAELPTEATTVPGRSAESRTEATTTVARASRWPALALLAALLLAAGGVAWKVSRPRAAPAPPATTRAPASTVAPASTLAPATAGTTTATAGTTTATAGTTTAASGAATSSTSAATAAPAPAGAAAPAPAVDAEPAARARTKRAGAPQPGPPSPRPGASGDAFAGDGTGWLSVGGEGALRAEIRVDGRRMGYAPKKIELPAGEHELELRAADERTIRTARIVITPRHTPSAPLVYHVP